MTHHPAHPTLLLTVTHAPGAPADGARVLAAWLAAGHAVDSRVTPRHGRPCPATSRAWTSTPWTPAVGWWD